MSYGFCYIPNRVPAVNGDAATWYAQLMEQWRLADRLGYDQVFIAEHRHGGVPHEPVLHQMELFANAVTEKPLAVSR
jgi:alkanesulfonate monooxygenase SsuD/methylene tetrahydromethanopterin reductase-like flavin-dependent oxidoreductase (luciferase family)